MEPSDSSGVLPEEEIIVRADEVDETGAPVSVLSAASDAELTSQVEERSQEPGDVSSLLPSYGNAVRDAVAVRPALSREGSAPPPPPPKLPPPPAPMREDQPAPPMTPQTPPPQQQQQQQQQQQSAPPTPAAQQPGHGPTDSLSLAQLKNMVLNHQGMEPAAYAYEYADTRTFAEEMEEWFQYTFEDRELLRKMRKSFEDLCRKDGGEDSPETSKWHAWLEQDRKRLIEELLREVQIPDHKRSTKSLEALGFVALGSWQGKVLAKTDFDEDGMDDFEPPNTRYKRHVGHIHAIREAAKCMCSSGAVEMAWKTFVETCAVHDYAPDDGNDRVASKDTESDCTRSRRDVCLSILYAAIEAGRWEAKHSKDQVIRRAFISLDPFFLTFMCQQISRVRWDEDHDLQLTRGIQLLWKGMLLILGSNEDLVEAKNVLLGKNAPAAGEKPQSLLTTTPLDYHIFRQEIMSKYPAYKPPPPLLPLEPENSSLLPPLPRSSRVNSMASIDVEPAKFNKSIFEEPVHITTPVPSPPPSPAGPGGKGGKKQNYQTNQSFPFLYPPMDSSSNDLGGKGGVARHNKVIGNRWEGSNVPASIIEAGELFASRMKMSRPTRQLWEAREACIKYDRGWSNEGHVGGFDFEFNEDVTELKLYEGSDDEKQEVEKDEGRDLNDKQTPKSTPENPVRPTRIPETSDTNVQERLDLAASFYRGSLPHLQSVVIVVLKILLANISATGGQAGSNQPSPALPDFPIDREINELQLPRHNINLVKQLSNASNPNAPPQDDAPSGNPVEALNSTRIREITSKAISGTLLTMLKWFRLSHILKFQFLTQLLLDSNYLPLALKYLAMQDVDRAVDRRTDIDRLSFFDFCREDSGLKPCQAGTTTGNKSAVSPTTSSTDEEEAPALSGSPGSSDDEAAPPPIRRRRGAPSPPAAARRNAAQFLPDDSADDGNEVSSPPGSPPEEGASGAETGGAGGARARRPEVNELGYPTTALPQAPLTTYAPRFFFTTISLLRVLQKVSKAHAHRALLLVQYKSSTILRKPLKIPQPQLRLYTLKLFKSQVPFCGRKWRQANMRVITAIYVFCRMGLRDDWISGAGAVDDWVDNALTTEQGWRGLVGWWHSRFFRDAVGLDGLAAERDEDEEDFFVRELEKMGWADHGEGEEEEGGQEWESGLLQPEGW